MMLADEPTKMQCDKRRPAVRQLACHTNTYNKRYLLPIGLRTIAGNLFCNTYYQLVTGIGKLYNIPLCRRKPECIAR